MFLSALHCYNKAGEAGYFLRKRGLFSSQFGSMTLISASSGKSHLQGSISVAKGVTHSKDKTHRETGSQRNVSQARSFTADLFSPKLTLSKTSMFLFWGQFSQCPNHLPVDVTSEKSHDVNEEQTCGKCTVRVKPHPNRSRG